MKNARIINFVRENRDQILSLGRKIARVVAASLGTKGVMDEEWALFICSLIGYVLLEVWSFYEQSKDSGDGEKPKA